MDRTSTTAPQEGRRCATCGIELVQREGESNWNYRKRKTCSKVCADIATGRGTRKPRVAEDRVCEVCGGPIPYRGEELWRWRQRQTCGRPTCTSDRRTSHPVLDEKPCKQCGTLMRRGGQKSARFKAKQFCCYECSVAFKRASLPSTKTCVVCGAPMERRANEGAKGWRARETCSTACRYALVGKSNALTKPALVAEPKTCVVCGNIFRKRRDESHVTFAIKKACTRKCASVLIEGHRVDLGSKLCRMCGTEFTRRDDEQAGNFRIRLYCSPKCAGDAISEAHMTGRERIDAYPRGWNKYVKGEVRARDRYACQE